MKLLFDVVFEGSFELESLDDILPLMEVVDWYKIKQDTVHRICDEAILAEIDPSNYIRIRTYVNLLQKFASVMSEATNKMMCYCNKFNKIKDLPELGGATFTAAKK